MKLEELTIKIFADGADPVVASEQAKLPYISGFTTNPSLMRKAGVGDYAAWADIFLGRINGKPVSFEVLSDDFEEMERQARKIAAWGENVYVKIPVTNTRGHTALPLVQRLLSDGVQVNVTAITTGNMLNAAYASALMTATPAILSVFAGRMADTGVDPQAFLRTYLSIMIDRQYHPSLQVLWASAREIYNVVQAQDAGCDIITLSPDLIAKLPILGKDLTEFSLETVRQFYSDAIAAGYTL